MSGHHITSFLRYIFLTAIVASLTGCRSSLDSSYFADLSQLPDSGVIKASAPKIRIRPADELSITVNSIVPDATTQYNLPQTNVAAPTGGGTLTHTGADAQLTYVVNADGDIDMPAIGRLHVEGMTISQLTDTITQIVSRQVKDPSVKVDLVNFHVNVLGQVAKPMQVKVGTERFSIFDALAAAGDVSVYGRLDNVMVLREQPDGTIAYGRLDLRKSDAARSPYFYLCQNDVIIVDPTSVRKDNAKYNQNNSFKLSVVSTIVSTISVIASLIIAFTR